MSTLNEDKEFEDLLGKLDELDVPLPPPTKEDTWKMLKSPIKKKTEHELWMEQMIRQDAQDCFAGVEKKWDYEDFKKSQASHFKDPNFESKITPRPTAEEQKQAEKEIREALKKLNVEPGDIK